MPISSSYSVRFAPRHQFSGRWTNGRFRRPRKASSKPADTAPPSSSPSASSPDYLIKRRRALWLPIGPALYVVSLFSGALSLPLDLNSQAALKNANRDLFANAQKVSPDPDIERQTQERVQQAKTMSLRSKQLYYTAVGSFCLALPAFVIPRLQRVDKKQS
jgi:hypothetical protein